MSKRFRRFYNKSLKEVDEMDKKNVDIIESADGSVTVVKKEEIRKNYRNNKLIKNDEDSKIIQDFCRKHLRITKNTKKEEKVEDVKKEEEPQSTSKRGYYSRFRRNKNQQENETSNISPEKQKSINENTDKNNNNQTEQNKEETNNSRKYYRRRFFKKTEESNQNGSPEENSSNQNKITANSISKGKDKNDKNEIEENKSPLRYKRKKYNSEEKKEQIEDKKPKFVPTYHEKKKYVEKDSQFNNKLINLKGYRCQEMEAIPVKFCNDYDYGYGYNSRMRFLSPVKTLYVQPFLNPNIIITKIKLDDNFIQRSNIGYASGINDNPYSYRNNISRNGNYNNNNLFGREIFKSQYKTEYKYIHPFSNIDNSRNVGI